MSDKKQHIPNGGSANVGDVKDYNRKVNNTSTEKKAPAAGSGAPKPPTPSKPSIRKSTTFDWKEVGTWDSEDASDKSESLRVLKKIETYVIDHFYGDWYWNTGIMIGTCFFSWLVARIGLGFFSLLVVLLGTNSVYRLEFRRFNRDIRDDMTRILASNRLEEELETMEWLNSFLDKFWVIYMPALSEQVMFIANDVLKDQAPGMGIEKISLDEFTLGSKAPRVDSIKSYTRKGQDHIEMDWAFSFAPNDTDDMTKNEIKKKINPKVALGVTIGKAFISKSLPILVEDMAFTGRMNIKLKLSENFPHVKMVSVQFLEAPSIDYALKPVGGDTLGLDIMTFIPGLSSFVNTLIHANLRPMLYAPNSLDIDVEEILAQQSNDSNGCVSVTVKRAMKLKSGADTKANSLNPYVQLKLSANPDVNEKTKVKKAINDPVFVETKFLLVNNLDGNFLTFNVYDFVPDKPNDTLIGSVEVPLVDLLQKEVQTGLVKNIMESGKTVGKIEFDLRYFPALEPLVLDDGSKEDNTDAEVGIAKINLVGASDLELSDSAVGLLNPYAEIYVNDELVKKCRRLRGTNEPSWNQSFETLITQQSETKVEVLVKDSANENIVGRLDANLQDILFETSRGQEWIKTTPIKEGGSSPKIRITANWKALGITDEKVAAETNFGAPIGGLRLHIRNSTDLKNLEAVGEVDPYVKIMVNGKLRGKTQTIAETCNPVFNKVYFFPINNEHQHLLLSIMDAEPEGKDRSLGSCAIHVNDFIKKNSKGYYLGYDGSDEIIEQPVLLDGQLKGSLNYSVSFIPTIPILTQTQIHNKKGYEKYLHASEEREKARRIKEEKLVKDYPDKFEFIEIDEEDLPAPPRTYMPLEDIIKYRAGTLSVNILHGRFAKADVFLQTLFDDQAGPSGVSPKLDSRTLTTATAAESFIRDLPNSKTIFRVSKRFEVKHQDDIVVEKSFDTIELFKRSYNRPIDLRIDEHNIIKIQLDFVPTAVKLHPLDTILDVGHVKLEILRGENIKSVDLNGKSDPMAIIQLDGIDVYKTDKKRKTLDPQWNETAEFPMLSRSRQVLLVEVYDWDLTHDPELLGIANVDLSSLEPHASTPFSVDLDTQGKVYLRATFKPDYIRPSVESGGGLPIDLKGVAGAPLKLVGGAAGIAGGVAGGVGGAAADGLGKGGSFLKGLGRRKRKKKYSNGQVDDGSGDDTLSAVGSVASSSASPTKLRLGRLESRSQYANDLQSLRSGQPLNGSSTKQSSADSEFNEEEEDEEKDSESKEQKEEDDKPHVSEDDVNVKTKKEPEPIVAIPNVNHDTLPAPQKPNFHSRTVSDVSTPDSTIDNSFSSSVGTGAIPGRLTIVSASGYSGSSLEIKTILKSPGKDRAIHKTRSSKLDKKTGLFKWNESVPFKSSPDSQLVLVVRERHTFSSKNEVDTLTLDLSTFAGKHEDITLSGQNGTLNVNLRFIE